MSSYRPSPLAALLNGLGGSLPDFTNALVKRKWAGQDAEALMAEKRREEEAKAAAAAAADARDMRRFTLLDIPATASQRMEADQALAENNNDVQKTIFPGLPREDRPVEYTEQGNPFQRVFPTPVEDKARSVAKTLGMTPKPKASSGAGRAESSVQSLADKYIKTKLATGGWTGAAEGYKFKRMSPEWVSAGLEIKRSLEQALKRKLDSTEQRIIGDLIAESSGVRG